MGFGSSNASSRYDIQISEYDAAETTHAPQRLRLLNLNLNLLADVANVTRWDPHRGRLAFGGYAAAR